MTEKDILESVVNLVIHRAANIAAENVNLNQDGEGDNGKVVFSERHNKKMQKLFSRYRRHSILSNVRKSIYKNAVSLLIGVLLFSVTALSVQAMGVTRIGGFLNEFFNSFPSLRYYKENDDSVMQANEFRFHYIPNGFVQEKENIRERSLFYKFKSNNLYIYISIMPIPNFRLFDEDVQIQLLMINGTKANLIETSDANIIVWVDDVYEFQVIGNIDLSELIQVAESIQKITPDSGTD